MMDIVGKVKSVITDPVGFFTKLKREKGLSDAFVFLALLSIIGLVGGILVGLLYPAELEQIGTFVGPVALVLAGIIAYGIGLGLSFVWAGILHFWIMLWGGKAPYERTYQLSVYSSVPSLLLGWAPWVGMLAGIYSLILIIIGTTKTHNVSLRRSILLYVIPLAVLVVIGLLLLGTAFFFLEGTWTALPEA